MHTYEKARAHEARELSTARFRSADDVAEWARTDHLIGWKTWPEAWHLDEWGAPTCFTRGSSLCGIVPWAEDPYVLLRSREDGLLEGGCASDWLIIESRPRWMRDTTSDIETVDAAAFVEVERVLAGSAFVSSTVLVSPRT